MPTSLPAASQLRSVLKKEWEFLCLTASLTSMMAVMTVSSVVTTHFAGQISQAHLNGVGLAGSLYNLVVTSISLGFSTVFDIYGPQVYGSGNPGQLGKVLQACLLQGLLVNLVVHGIFFNGVYVIDIQRKIGQSYEASLAVTGHDDTKDIAVKYMRMLCFVEYLDYIVSTVSAYIAIQGYNRFALLISVVQLITHILSNYVLVALLNLHVLGLALSNYVSRFTALSVSVIICFVMVRNGRFYWEGFTTKALIGWMPMLKFGMFGAVCSFTSTSLVEISIYLCQFGGADTMSVYIIMMQLGYLSFSVSVGTARSAAMLVGQSLSEGDREKNDNLHQASFCKRRSIFICDCNAWLLFQKV